MKQLFSYILFLFSTVFTYGQVTLEISDVRDQKVNQRFKLTVLLEISGENMEQETPLRMPDMSKFDIIGSASERNTIVLDAKKGDVVNQLIYQYVLSPKQPGKIKFGSALVTVNGKIYKTEPFDISVRDNEKANAVAENSDKNDLYLNLEIQDKVVYKNEPTLAVLRAYSSDYDNFRKVGKVVVPHQKNANIKLVSSYKSEIESKSGVASQVIATFIVFPSESGTVNINPISASFPISAKENRISSNKVQLNVKKLPAGMPAHFKNAVGRFTVNVVKNTDEETSEIEKPLSILLKVSGFGNFASLHLPKILDSNNYLYFPPKITTETSTLNSELKGTTTAEYVVIPKKAGTFPINFEGFSYFDPIQRKYTDLGAEQLIINVKTSEQIADSKTTLEKVNEYTNTVLETVNTPVLQTHAMKVKSKDGINWKIIAGNIGLLGVLVSLFLVVMRKKEQKKLKPKLISKPIITIAETEEILRNNSHHDFEENIEYLKKLKDSKDFTTFFTAYEELNKEIKKQFGANSDADFRAILTKTKGQQTSEKYRVLSEQIQIEKFAPFHFEEQMEELYERIVTFYNDVTK